MAVSVDWGNQEETLIVWKFGKNWYEDEYYIAAEVFQILVQKKNHPIAVILDLRTAYYNQPVNLIPILRHLSASCTQHVSSVIFLAYTGLWERLVNIERKQHTEDYHFDFHFVKTVDEAYHLTETSQYLTPEVY